MTKDNTTFNYKLDENFFWIEQQIGCAFQFICKNGIITFLLEEEDKPYEELSLDSKVYRKLKEKFDGKHILELQKGIASMRPYMKIKNYFVAEQFEKHNIFRWRREPESTLDSIKQLEKWIVEVKTTKRTGMFSTVEAAVEHYQTEIDRLKNYIKTFQTNKDYLAAKAEYDKVVINKMKKLHGITYGYNNVVDFN